jgi:hypothetical protein
MTLVRDVFGDRIMEKYIWPQRLPDLIPRDYYLWVNTNCAVYKNNPHSLLELKEGIADFIRNIPLIELSRVFANKIRRIDACLHAHAGYFQNWF